LREARPKFDDQETEVEKLQGAIKKLQEQEHLQRREYDKFLVELNVD